MLHESIQYRKLHRIMILQRPGNRPEPQHKCCFSANCPSPLQIRSIQKSGVNFNALVDRRQLRRAFVEFWLPTISITKPFSFQIISIFTACFSFMEELRIFEMRSNKFLTDAPCLLSSTSVDQAFSESQILASKIFEHSIRRSTLTFLYPSCVVGNCRGCHCAIMIMMRNRIDLPNAIYAMTSTRLPAVVFAFFSAASYSELYNEQA